MGLTVDREFQSLIPSLSTEERDGLEADIIRDGRATVPLIVWGKILLDGHNRYYICTKHGLPFETKQIEGIKDRLDARIWIGRTQLNRRNLDALSRIKVAKQVVGDEGERRAAEAIETGRRKGGNTAGRGRPKDAPSTDSSKTNLSTSYPPAVNNRAAVAALANVSEGTVENAERVLSEDAAPELRDAVARGDVSISAAADLTELPKAEQADAVKDGPRATKKAAKVVRQKKREKKRQKRVEKIAAISESNESLTDKLGTFPVLYADPPWRYEHVETESRAIENQYPTMTIDEICALPVAKLATADAWLFMWATSPKLAEAMRVLQAWGFEYRTCAVWVKPSIGMGYIYRQRHELLLVAKRGAPPTPAPADRPDSVIEAPDGEHSAKPDLARKQIERMFPKWKRIELFARTAPKGWSVWGNQAR